MMKKSIFVLIPVLLLVLSSFSYEHGMWTVQEEAKREDFVASWELSNLQPYEASRKDEIRSFQLHADSTASILLGKREVKGSWKFVEKDSKFAARYAKSPWSNSVVILEVHRDQSHIDFIAYKLGEAASQLVSAGGETYEKQ
ncbi:hypothetical protein [Echinicola sp. 20G]|uniref:hypothetical protein n=1 Tax=Echinicola sp. 20G TaxID=2781961 RepID=UPI001910C3EE|nr:hypothetical protein [Echinicola sp. 20G]